MESFILVQTLILLVWSHTCMCSEQNPFHVTNFHHPDFLLIGTVKSGSTSFYHYLTQHPQIQGVVKKYLLSESIRTELKRIRTDKIAEAKAKAKQSNKNKNKNQNNNSNNINNNYQYNNNVQPQSDTDYQRYLRRSLNANDNYNDNHTTSHELVTMQYDNYDWSRNSDNNNNVSYYASKFEKYMETDFSISDINEITANWKVKDFMMMLQPIIDQKEVRYFDEVPFNRYMTLFHNNTMISFLLYLNVFNQTISKYDKEIKYNIKFGETSPTYFIGRHSAQRIKNVLPNVKCILLLRNPVDRFYSHIRMSKDTYGSALRSKGIDTEIAIEQVKEWVLRNAQKWMQEENRAMGHRGRMRGGGVGGMGGMAMSGMGMGRMGAMGGMGSMRGGRMGGRIDAMNRMQQVRGAAMGRGAQRFGPQQRRFDRFGGGFGQMMQQTEQFGNFDNFENLGNFENVDQFGQQQMTFDEYRQLRRRMFNVGINDINEINENENESEMFGFDIGLNESVGVNRDCEHFWNEERYKMRKIMILDENDINHTINERDWNNSNLNFGLMIDNFDIDGGYFVPYFSQNCQFVGYFWNEKKLFEHITRRRQLTGSLSSTLLDIDENDNDFNLSMKIMHSALLQHQQEMSIHKQQKHSQLQLEQRVSHQPQPMQHETDFEIHSDMSVVDNLNGNLNNNLNNNNEKKYNARGIEIDPNIPAPKYNLLDPKHANSQVYLQSWMYGLTVNQIILISGANNNYPGSHNHNPSQRYIRRWNIPQAIVYHIQNILGTGYAISLTRWMNTHDIFVYQFNDQHIRNGKIYSNEYKKEMKIQREKEIEQHKQQMEKQKQQQKEKEKEKEKELQMEKNEENDNVSDNEMDIIDSGVQSRNLIGGRGNPRGGRPRGRGKGRGRGNMNKNMANAKKARDEMFNKTIFETNCNRSTMVYVIPSETFYSNTVEVMHDLETYLGIDHLNKEKWEKITSMIYNVKGNRDEKEFADLAAMGQANKDIDDNTYSSNTNGNRNNNRNRRRMGFKHVAETVNDREKAKISLNDIGISDEMKEDPIYLKRKEQTRDLLSNYYKKSNRKLRKLLGGYAFQYWDY